MTKISNDQLNRRELLKNSVQASVAAGMTVSTAKLVEAAASFSNKSSVDESVFDDSQSEELFMFSGEAGSGLCSCQSDHCNHYRDFDDVKLEEFDTTIDLA